MKTCKVCGELKDETKFHKTRTINDKVYRSKTCGKCDYKLKKERGAISKKRNRESWNNYQREYARVNYYAYYERRGQKNE